MDRSYMKEWGPGALHASSGLGHSHRLTHISGKHNDDWLYPLMAHMRELSHGLLKAADSHPLRHSSEHHKSG